MSYVHCFTVFETVVNHLTHWTMLQPNIWVNDIYQEMQITNRQTSISHCSCIMRHHHAPCIIILIFIISITNHHKSSQIIITNVITSSWPWMIIMHHQALYIVIHHHASYKWCIPAIFWDPHSWCTMHPGCINPSCGCLNLASHQEFSLLMLGTQWRTFG